MSFIFEFNNDLAARHINRHAGWHANLSKRQLAILIDRVNAPLNGANPLVSQPCLFLQATVTMEDGQVLTIAQAQNADTASASSHRKIIQTVVNNKPDEEIDGPEEAGPADRYHDAYAANNNLPYGSGVGYGSDDDSIDSTEPLLQNGGGSIQGP